MARVRYIYFLPKSWREKLMMEIRKRDKLENFVKIMQQIPALVKVKKCLNIY
jgi:hypothetical protein